MARPVDTVPARVTEDGAVVVTAEVPLVVEAGTVATTDMTYENGLLVSYVEGGVTWTVARDGDGNITSITPAA